MKACSIYSLDDRFKDRMNAMPDVFAIESEVNRHFEYVTDGSKFAILYGRTAIVIPMEVANEFAEIVKEVRDYNRMGVSLQ